MFPKKSQLNSHNQSQKWALFKLSGVKAWEVSSSILSKKVKSVKKMSETRNGKSDFGIFITKDSLVISKRASRFTVALQELACGAASDCEKSLVVF